ncbi:MAG: ABC transporter permease subunit [Chloroflexi bacterium]|nr:ABC transporter permease subunit [Chloroflexota bacterium]
MVISLIIFSATEFLPGDAASILLGQQGTPTTVENLRHRMGLDRPAHVRYISWIVGWPESEGTLFRTSDGGATWQRLGTDTITPLSRTSFVSPKLGWAISERRIYSTEDGGTRWTRQIQSEQRLRAIAFVDEKNGLAVGDGGTIYRTTEGGGLPGEQGVLCAGSTCEDETLSTWAPVESGTASALTDIAFVDSSHLWIAGEKGLVLRSTDGGVTFETVDTGVNAMLLSVSFASADQGVVVGEGGTILVTADGGRTWQQSDAGTSSRLNAVDFASDGSVWAVGDGGTALQSRDGGVTWARRTIGTSLKNSLRAVSFDGADGVVVGSKGTVLTTSDGGASWTRQEILEGREGTITGQEEPTARPLNDVAIHVGESGDVSAWAASDDSIWRWGVLGGDLGVSPRSGVSILWMIKNSLPNSAILALFAFIVAVPSAVAAGVWMGIRPDTKLDRLVSQGSLLAISLPEFVTGILLILLFSSTLGWLPSSSIMLPGESVWSRPEVMVLPVLTITGALFAYIMRMARANVIEVMDSDYVRTAILKGLPMRRVVVRHVLPNAMLPTITVIANNVGWMFGGLIIVESVFAYPGVGRLLLTAIDTRDVRLLQSTALVIAAVYAFSNLTADLLYGVLNPRIRLA